MDTNVVVQLITGLLFVALGIAVLVLMLFVSREITAWYFKTNEIIEILKQIRDAQDDE